jgi:ABC-2 type transport system permease protein
MTLWRLEWLRLTRTRRVVALAGVFLFFGAVAAPMSKYAADIVERFGGGAQIVLPPPTAVDGLTNYVSNVEQLGLLVYVVLLAGTLAFDAQREMAIFLRLRVRSVRQLIVPRFAVTAAAGIVAFLAGLLVTCFGTVTLLGSLDAAAVIEGAVLFSVYLVFVAALVAAVASLVRSVVSTAIVSVVILLLLELVGVFDAVTRWLPSHLPGALTDLERGADASSYLRSLVITALAVPVLLALAARWSATREL